MDRARRTFWVTTETSNVTIGGTSLRPDRQRSEEVGEEEYVLLFAIDG